MKELFRIISSHYILCGILCRILIEAHNKDKKYKGEPRNSKQTEKLRFRGFPQYNHQLLHSDNGNRFSVKYYVKDNILDIFFCIQLMNKYVD